MKKKLLTFSLLALLCACGGTNNLSSSVENSSSEENISSEVVSQETPTNIEDFTFETTSLGALAINEDGGLTITKYVCKKNSTVNVIVPEEYSVAGSTRTYKITRIADKAFQFAGGIETVTLSKNIKYCSSAAFGSCTTLKGIYVDEANENYSSRNDLLYSKDGKTLVSGPNGKKEVLIDSVTEIISASAFSSNVTENFIIEEGVKVIETRAFEKTKKAQSITLPNSVISIEEYIFANSDFKTINFGTGISIIPSYALYQCSVLDNVVIPGNVKTIKYSAIGDNQHLKTLTLEEGVETIDEYGISFNTNLKNLTLPTSLRTIGKCGFISSPSLVNVNIPEGVVSIGDGAFSHSTALETLHISSTVNEIGEGITQYCTKFKSFTVSTDNTSFIVNDSALYSKDMKRLLAVPQYYGEPGYHTYILDSSVEKIDNYAFNYSIRISKVVLPANLSKIGAAIFANSAVEEVQFLGTVEDFAKIERTAVVEEVETAWNALSSISSVECVDGTFIEQVVKEQSL